MLINDFPLIEPAVSSLEQRIQAALEAMRDGIPVVLLDDFDRENEADLIVAAERLTTEQWRC